MKLYRLYDSIVLEYDSSTITTISAFSFNAIKRSSTYVFRSQKNPISQRISLSEIKKKDNSSYTEIELDDLISSKFGLYEDVVSGSTSFASITGEFSDNVSLDNKFAEVEGLIFDLDVEATHSNRSILDLITESFTTSLKIAYDSTVTWISAYSTSLLNHLSNTSNPHNVTKSQIGLSNVDNTSDLDKPVSTATQTEIDATNTAFNDFVTVDYINDLNSKQDVLASGNNIKTIDGFNVLGSGDVEILDSTNVFLFNDFLAITALQPFVGGAISTGTLTQNTSNFSANTLGVGRVTKSTTANSGYRVVTDATSIRIKGGEIYKQRFCPLNITTCTHRGGFMDATTVTESVDGIYFQYANNGNLVLKTSNNSVRTTSSVLTTLSLNTWYTVEIIVNSNATSVIMNLYDADGDLIGTTAPIETNIPTAVGRECGVGFVCTGSSVTADTLANIDYIQFKQKLIR